MKVKEESEKAGLKLNSRQSSFDAQYWMLGAGALGRPRGMVQEGGRRFQDGEHMYTVVDSFIYMAKPIQ